MSWTRSTPSFAAVGSTVRGVAARSTGRISPTGATRACTRTHTCRPLGSSAIRHIHFLLSGAYERAVRWRWVAVNPLSQASPPAAPKREAARTVTESWRGPDWGALVWTAMTTRARRGELCAIRLTSVDLDRGRETLWLRRAIRKEHGRLVEAELKTHQQRRVALDAETGEILREHIERSRTRAAALGFELSSDVFLFSGAPDGSTSPVPDSVTQRYERLADRLESRPRSTSSGTSPQPN